MPRSPALRRVLALLLWAVLLASFVVLASRHPGGILGVLAAFLHAVTLSPRGLLLLAGLYLVRPLLLLPVTVLTAFCGYLFGPLLGLLVAEVAGVASAVVGYLAVRWWRGTPPAVPAAWWQRLRRGTFEAVLVSRLSFVPGDLVNGAAGVLALRLGPFVAATALGGLPGAVVGVLAGAGMRGASFEAAPVRLHPAFIAGSLGLALASLAVGMVLRRRRPMP